MKAHYISRHNKALLLLNKALSLSTMAPHLRILDATAGDALPAGVTSNRIPDWVLPNVDPSTRLKFRPDIMVIENLPTTDYHIQALRTCTDPTERARLCRNRHLKIHLVELGYTSCTRYLEKLEEKRQQHAHLRSTLLQAGWPSVSITPLVLSTGGHVPTDVITWLQSLAIPPTTVTSIAHKLNALAVRKGHDIIISRRCLEHASKPP
jgi:hypothetical protein